MAKKGSEVRPKITLACTECKERNYITKKNRRNDPDRLELAKFCPRCGSPVYAHFGDEIGVNLGSFDAPDTFRPTYELWTVRREAWLPPFPLSRRYDRDRDSDSREEP